MSGSVPAPAVPGTAPTLLARIARVFQHAAPGLALLAGLALVAAFAAHAWSIRTERLANARAASIDRAAAAAQQAEAAFSAADLRLAAIAARLQSDGAGASALAPLLDPRSTLPVLHAVTVYNEDGTWLAGSLPDPRPEIAARAREAAVHHAQQAESAPRLGPVYRSARDGRIVVTLTRRFDQPDGHFGGVVEAALDVGTFTAFYATQAIGPHGTMAMWRDDGMLLARQPAIPSMQGRWFRNMDDARRIAFGGGSGVFDTQAVVDGESRSYAYHHLDRFPVVVFDGVAPQDALAGWQAETEWQAALLAGALLMTGFAAHALRRSRRALRAESGFASAAAHVADVIFTLDPRFRLRYVTPSVRDVFGLDPASLAGTTLLRRVHPADRPAVAAVYQAMRAGQERASALYRVRHADGQYLWVEVELAIARPAPQAPPTAIVGAARDVTARKAAEDALLAEQAFFQAVFDHTNDRLFVQRVLPGGRFAVERINPAAASALGIAPAAAIGQSPQALFGNTHGAMTEAALRRTLAARQVQSMEQDTPGGVPLQVIAVPIAGPDGGIARILTSARDVTGQKRMQAAEQRLRASEAATDRLDRLAGDLARARDRAEQANQAKSRFLTSMSHELRTPLNGILGYAQLLQMEGGLRPSQAEHVAGMLAAGRHLLEMITSVLDMAQIEADKITLQAAEVNLADLAQACLGLVRPVADAKGLALTFTAAPGAPARLQVDPLRLRQVMLNLLGNAVKFTQAGAVELRLVWSAARDAIRLEVADTGPGIPEGQRARLFGAFERLEDAAIAPIEGAGLGLAISARLVAAMAGRIGCEAGPRGAGSVFWVELPARHAAGPASAAPAAPPQAAAPLDLLVVDDMANNRDIACAFLRSAGHRVTSASGGQEAVDLAAAGAFDVILMDVRMPDIDGLEATRRIRALPGARGQVPVIAVTAQAFAEQIAQCRAAGMDHHLPKPFEVAALLDAVATAAVPRQAAPPESAALCVLDRAAFEETAAYLPHAEVNDHLHALAARGRSLLAMLHDGTRPADTAELAHAMAGAAGTFGFQSIADAGRRFEYAVDHDGADQAALAALLGNVTTATIAALEGLIAEKMAEAA